MEKPPCGGQIPTALLHGRSHQPLSGGSRGTPSPSRRNYRRRNAGSTGTRQTSRFESTSVCATLSTPPPARRRRRAFDWSTAVIAALAFAAAHRVIDRVHDHAAHMRSSALPASTSCFAAGNVHMIDVANLANGREAVLVNPANFARGHFHQRVAGFDSSKRSLLPGTARDLAAASRSQFNVVNICA